jgi:hypothetical protein
VRADATQVRLPIQCLALVNAKPFCANFSIAIDLNGDPLIACRVVEVNRYIAEKQSHDNEEIYQSPHKGAQCLKSSIKHPVYLLCAAQLQWHGEP